MAAQRLNRIMGQLSATIGSGLNGSSVTSSTTNANMTNLTRDKWPGTGYDLIQPAGPRQSLKGKTVFITGVRPSRSPCHRLLLRSTTLGIWLV
jgi:hypothetical protein